MKKSHKIIAVSTLAVGSLLIAPAAFAADNTVTQTVTGGTLTASATDVSLGSVATAHTAQNSTGQLTVSADDSTGSGAGWHVTEQVSSLAYTGTNGGTAIPASDFSITSVGAVAMTAGQTIDTTGTDASPTGPQIGNITNGVSGTLDNAVTVLVAGPNFGQGTYTVPVNVNLAVPANTRAGSYAGTLTTTITSAP